MNPQENPPLASDSICCLSGAIASLIVSSALFRPALARLSHGNKNVGLGGCLEVGLGALLIAGPPAVCGLANLQHGPDINIVPAAAAVIIPLIMTLNYFNKRKQG